MDKKGAMDVDEVLKKYSRKIEQQIKSDYSVGKNIVSGNVSKDYSQFKEDMMPALSRYEKWAKSLGSFLKIKSGGKGSEKMMSDLNRAHLDVTPQEVSGLAFISFIIIFLAGLFSSFSVWLITGELPMLFFLLVVMTAGFSYYYFITMPSRLAVKWKLKASSQMVPAILYTVIYMKHTSNLERAINFVSQHIEAPLSLDFRKILWDVETGRFSSVKDSLDFYLDFWRETNIEFVESFHLIESSLYEPSEARRIQILERALRVILDGVYERMLKYTHTIKAPLTNLYMIGIVLPTLGLALLPLASTLLGGMIQSVHVIILFDLIIPFVVFYMTLEVMLKRPGGYGETSLLEKNPYYYEYASKKPYYLAALVCLPFFIIGLIPLIAGYTPIPQLLGLVEAGQVFDPQLPTYLSFLGNGGFFGFLENGGKVSGPFGVGATLLSLFIPFSIAMFFYLSYSIKTKNLIKAREQTKDLENEFNSSLFTLGNRLGDGTPAEIAFSKVAQSVKGQKTEDFFKIVNSNIQSMGMSLDEAIFNPRRGALMYYPSGLIATSMRILIESAKKGLSVAAESLMSISEYVRNIQKINERLRDLLADVVSDMSSNMTFLAPLLAGIVIGLGGMISAILIQLKDIVTMGQGAESVAGLGTNILDIIKLFDPVNLIPPYFLQIAIGVYIIEIVFILTRTLVTIDSGEDKLKQTSDISKNLLRSGFLYLLVALIATLALSGLASIAVGGLLGG